MRAETVLVLDAGTSALRAIAVAPGGETTTVASEAWATLTPLDAAPFGREFDPVRVAASLHALLERAAARCDAIAGLAFTGQREGLACVAEDLAPIYAGPNVDARASAEGMEIDATDAGQVYQTTGHLPSLMQAPAKLAWLRRHRPNDSARACYVLPLADWLAMLVTRTPRVSRSLAAENGLVDVATGVLAERLIKQHGLPPELIPSLVEDGAAVGTVVDEPLAGTPVVLAGADTQCALVGLAAVEPGDAGVPAGWSAPLQLVTQRPIFDAQMRTWTAEHVVRGRWVLESNAGETGRWWQWACALAGVTPEAAERLAAESPPGANDVMAVLGARTMRASEMTAGMGGLMVPLPLVMSSPDRGDVLRAVLEGTAYALRANLEQLEEVCGSRIELLRLGGGMSRSPTFAQTLANVLDRQVEVARSPEVTAIGAAAMAGVAMRLHASIEEAVARLTGGRRILAPDLATSAVYDDGYARWCALADGFERLATETG